MLAVYAAILRGMREPAEARTFAELAVRDAPGGAASRAWRPTR